MRPVSIESTLLLFHLTQIFLRLVNVKESMFFIEQKYKL